MKHSEHCEESDSLVTVVYGEATPAERARFERHLQECQDCSDELREFQAVRGTLAEWSPPDPLLGFRIVQGPVRARSGWLAWSWPLWAQAAAAVLVIAGAAAVANLEVRYGADGLVLRTGWQRPVATPTQAIRGPAAPWRPELTALERQLRRDFSAPAPVQQVTSRISTSQESPVRRWAADAEALQRVKTMIDDSERRQQREFALRLAQLMRDVDTQRRADLTRIEQNFGQIEGLTGAAIQQQREYMNLLVRASQRR